MLKLKRHTPYIRRTNSIVLALTIITTALISGQNPIDAQSDARMYLVKDGTQQCAIVRKKRDAFAASKIASLVRERIGVSLPITEDMPKTGNAVLIGKAASIANIDISVDELGEEGYLIATRVQGDRKFLMITGGGRVGTIYGASDLKNYYLNFDERDVWVEPLSIREKPTLKYRWLWTWDWRMDWGSEEAGGDRMGGGGKYPKSTESFLTDYKNCIDFMSDHKINGLTLWGFLRDGHGGVEAAKEICEYAMERGVRILPGVGTSGYSGYYFEGDHQYNVQAWLKKRPELRAISRDGKPRNALCPSKKANQDWLDEGAKWLFSNFRIGGVNLEMGDFFVCHCNDCKKARAAILSGEPDYYKDMAISHSVTLKTVHSLAPDGWLSYATYTGFDREQMLSPPKFLDIIPDYAICQWTVTRMIANPDWGVNLKPPSKHSIGYAHWSNKSTQTERDFYLDRMKTLCEKIFASGMEGIATYGEEAATFVNNEVNYLAFAEFGWNPKMTMEEFVERRLSKLYGGMASAQTLLEIIPFIRTRSLRMTQGNIENALAMAFDAERSASSQGEERWLRFIDYLMAEKERRDEEIAKRTVSIEGLDALTEKGEQGFVIPQKGRIAFELDEDLLAMGRTILTLKARMAYSVEDGALHRLRIKVNGKILGSEMFRGKLEPVRFPNHPGHPTKPLFENDAWLVKYDTNFKIDLAPDEKYYIPDFDYTYRFDITSALQRGKQTRITIENLEERWLTTNRGSMVVEGLELNSQIEKPR